MAQRLFSRVGRHLLFTERSKLNKLPQQCLLSNYCIRQHAITAKALQLRRPKILYSPTNLYEYSLRFYATDERDPPRQWMDVHLPLLMSLVKDERAKIFDVRTVEEVEQTGMMPGATNIPLSEIREAFELSEDEFQSRYGVTKPVQRDLIVLHCLGGVRSQKALNILHEEGYGFARHYPGGWEEYEQFRNSQDIEKLRPWTDVTYEELMSMIKSKDIQLFDVRRIDEVESTGLMPGATHIPIHDLEEAFNMSPGDFKSKYGVDKPSKDDDNVVLSCALGFRSLAALSVLQNAGFDRFRQYEGGWFEYAKLSKG